MRLAILMLCLTLSLTAAEAQHTYVGTTTRSASAPDPLNAGSSANAARLVELLGTRKRFELDRKRLIVEARQQLVHEYPALTPALINGWVNKLATQYSPDDYVNLAAGVYASYFNEQELAELVQVHTNLAAGRHGGMSPALRDKLRTQLPAIEGDIAAGFVRGMTKLGADVAQQLIHEHPELVRR